MITTLKQVVKIKIKELNYKSSFLEFENQYLLSISLQKSFYKLLQHFIIRSKPSN